MEIKVTGSVTIDAAVRTVGDLRELVTYLDKYGVPDAALVDWGVGSIYILPLGEDFVQAYPIECGDHKPWAGDAAFDWLIESHQHPEQDETDLQERINQALREQEPANYDETREIIETVKDEWRGPGYK